MTTKTTKKTKRVAAWVWIVGLVGVSLLAGTGCEADSGGEATGAAEEAASAEEAAFELKGTASAGEEIYKAQCTSCHGSEGKGDGPAGGALTPKPTDFTASTISDYGAYQIVKTGGIPQGRSALMPGFERSLSDQELRDVVAYVQSFGD